MDDDNKMPEFALEELDDVAGGCGGGRRGDRNFFNMQCPCPPPQDNSNDMLMMMMMMQMFQDPRGGRRRR